MYYGQLVQLEVSRFSNPHAEHVARQAVEVGVPAVLVRVDDQTCLIVNDTPSEVDSLTHTHVKSEAIPRSFVVNGKLIGAEGNRFYFRAEYTWGHRRNYE